MASWLRIYWWFTAFVEPNSALSETAISWFNLDSISDVSFHEIESTYYLRLISPLQITSDFTFMSYFIAKNTVLNDASTYYALQS